MFASGSQKRGPGWFLEVYLGGSGLSGSFMSRWNRFLDGCVVVCQVQITISGGCGRESIAFQRLLLPGWSSGPPGEVLLQRHHLPPALLRRRPLPSLHAQMLLNLQLQIIALLDQCCCRETREQLIPLGIIPAKVCRNASSGQTSVQIIHKTLTFHPLWVALVAGFRGLTQHHCRICSRDLMWILRPMSLTRWDTKRIILSS